MIGYLSGAAVKRLIKEGVTKVLYGVSETPQYLGDLVSVYFLTDEGIEVAHQTQLSGLHGSPEATFYRRDWSGPTTGRGYRTSALWHLLRERDCIEDTAVLRVV